MNIMFGSLDLYLIPQIHPPSILPPIRIPAYYSHPPVVFCHLLLLLLDV